MTVKRRTRPPFRSRGLVSRHRAVVSFISSSFQIIGRSPTRFDRCRSKDPRCRCRPLSPRAAANLHQRRGGKIRPRGDPRLPSRAYHWDQLFFQKERTVTIIAQTAEELAAILRRGLSPLTNNRDALLALGFERAYPQVRKGHDSIVWERTIDHHRRLDGARVLVRERAYLVDRFVEK